MAIIVETGSQVANSNSYVTLAEVTAYMNAANLGAAWTAASAEAKEAAIVLGQMLMDVKYASRYVGYPVSKTQSMAWPRTRTPHNPFAEPTVFEPVIDNHGFKWATTEIPPTLKKSAYQAIQLQFQGVFTPTVLGRDQFIKKKKIDVLETEWFDGAPSTNYPVVLEQVLSSLISGGASGASGITMVFGLSTAEMASMSEYNWESSIHNWLGTVQQYASIDPYRDMIQYLYEQKGLA